MKRKKTLILTLNIRGDIEGNFQIETHMYVFANNNNDV